MTSLTAAFALQEELVDAAPVLASTELPPREALTAKLKQSQNAPLTLEDCVDLALIVSQLSGQKVVSQEFEQLKEDVEDHNEVRLAAMAFVIKLAYNKALISSRPCRCCPCHSWSFAAGRASLDDNLGRCLGGQPGITAAVIAGGKDAPQRRSIPG